MVKIIADSTCDLSQDLIQEHEIDILPLHILLGEDEYEDGKSITPDEIYKWSDEHKTTPKTSAPSIEHAMDLLKPYVDEKREVVFFTISEAMSTTANVIRLAAEELDAVGLIHVVNSKNLSTGIGLQVLYAADLSREGKSAAEIVESIEKIQGKVRASFVVDTLVYLHRGGRCSGLAAMFGSALKLHPRIDVVDGVMGPGKKYRGKMDHVVLSYAKDLEEALKNADKKRVFITHSGCDEEIVSAVQSYLAQLGLFEHIYITRAGGVISSHCGYGTLGVLFISK